MADIKIQYSIVRAYKGGKLGKPTQIGTRTKFSLAEADQILSSFERPKVFRIVVANSTAELVYLLAKAKGLPHVPFLDKV